VNHARGGVSSSAALRRAPTSRLLIVTLAVVVAFVGSTIYSHRVAAQLDDAAASIAMNAAPSVVVLSETRGELVGIERKAAQAVESAAAGARVDRTPSSKELEWLLTSIQEAFGRVHQSLTRYLALPFFYSEQSYWSVVEKSTRLFEQRVSAEVDELSAGHVQEAQTLQASEVRPAAEAADQALQRLIRFNADQQRRLALEIPRLRSRSVLVAYLLDGMSAALTILLMALILVEYRQRMRLHTQFSDRLEGIATASSRISEAIATASDLRVLFQTIADEARAALDVDYVALGCGTNPETPFEPWAFSGLSPEQARALGGAPRPVGVLAAVVEHRGPLRMADVTQHHAFHGLPAGHPPMAAFLGIPVLRNGRNVGNLYLARRPGRLPFTEDDEHAIELFATHAAVAVDSANLYQQLQKQRSNLQLLADASAQFTSLDYSETLNGIARALVPAFADLCVLHIVGPDERFCRQIVAPANARWAPTADPIPRHHPPLAEPHYAARVRQSRKAELIPVTPEFLDQLAGDAEHLRLLQQIPAKSLLSVPLIARDQLVGVCSFFSLQELRYGATEVSFAEEIARRAALSIDNALLYQKAEAATRASEELLAVVSHDLRNPLSAIRMGAQLLEATAGEDERGAQVRKQAARIKRSSDLMMRMIADLLDGAKIESGTLRAERQFEHVEALLDDALDLFHSGAAEKSIQLGSNVAQPVPDLWCDRDRVLQVLSNLIGNALRFTPPGGTITVIVRPLADQVQFTVADSGPGIPAEHLPHIFDRFWQPTSLRRGSAGLGLYIAKGIVEAHGGRIWADSRPEHGAMLSFTIPAGSPAPGPEELPISSELLGPPAPPPAASASHNRSAGRRDPRR
jgi:signal transduction histidine kinase